MSDAERPTTAARFNALEVPLENQVTLVEASAGTGKTFAITRLVLRLLLERKVDSLSRILVVTFTEKATQELVTRIRATLRLAEQVWSDAPPPRANGNLDLFALRDLHGDEGRAIIAQALGALDDLAVSTIHGFCQRILSESALESRIPFRTTFIEDESGPFARAARDWARKNVMQNAEVARLVVDHGCDLDKWVKELLSKYRRMPQSRVEYDAGNPNQSLLASFVRSVDDAFNKEKERRHLLGFDDLLTKLAKSLKQDGKDGALARRIRARFSAALIDEFQDTDQTQFSIFTIAFTGVPLFLIGDPKQSIYRFRGADIHAYLRASKVAERSYTLLENFRSTPAYVRAVEALFTRARDPFLVSEQDIPFPRVKAANNPSPPEGLATDGRAAMEWWWIDDTLGKRKGVVSKEVAGQVVRRELINEIVRLNAGGLPFGAIAVLMRGNREAREVKAALDRARIPAVIGNDEDVLNSEEADELSRLAAAIATPHDGGAVRSAMATRLWGSNSADIARTLEDDGDEAMQAVAGRLMQARDLWRTRGIAAAFGELLVDRGAAERLLTLPDGARRLTNVRHVTELFHEAWATEGIAPEGFAAWLASERTVLNTPGRRELRLETDSQAVQVMTIHKAKGLEFDVVFCPELWQTHEVKAGPLDVNMAFATEGEFGVLDLGSPRVGERMAAEQREDDAEALRLAYVALTRARHRSYVAWGNIGQHGAGATALGHLLRASDGNTDVNRAALDDLVTRAGGVMAVHNVAADGPTLRAFPVRDADRAAEPRPLSLTSDRLLTWRMTSFTGLTLDAHSEEGRDVSDPLMLPTIGEEPLAITGFRAFPAGRQAGIALHDVFEALDFRRPGDERAREMVRRTLSAYGLLLDAENADARIDDVMAMLARVTTAPIPGAAFALESIPLRDSLREWRFDLSVATPSARRIADALALHGSPHARAYAPLLRTLRDSTIGGYLNGVIDIAFEHDDQWWLVDWKSNQLGAADHDYAPDALDLAMREAHYTLQYHLYLLALHRHLQLRQPGYDPAKHWGGVAYVFLRGVAGVGEHGWFLDRPTPALLNALDTALGRRR